MNRALTLGSRTLSLIWCSVAIILVFGLGCAPSGSVANAKTSATPTGNSSLKEGASIKVDAGGPADTVRAFYRHLRAGKIREAIFLTNLRPAIEGLTDSELKEFAIDFEAVAAQVPPEIDINGEIISKDLATVTANLPSPDTEKNEIQTIKLRNQAGTWVILTVDEAAEGRIQKEGKNYFYSLRIATHEEEARAMLERISKAQMVHSMQSGGSYADLATLVSAGLLPEDIRSSESTGYNYRIDLAADNKRYTATAVPAVYGKTGRLSFLLELDNKGVARVSSKDKKLEK